MSVEVARKDRLLTVTWDKPPLNVLDIVLLRELENILERCAVDSAVDVVVLRGQGQKAFSAGVDIKDHTKEKVPEMLAVVHGVIRKLLSLPQVTIAAVRGACLGGGCEVASVLRFYRRFGGKLVCDPGNSRWLLPSGGTGALCRPCRLSPGGGNDSHRATLYCARGQANGFYQPRVCR